MDLVPCEILEIIANNLDLRDIINLRNSSKFIYDCLNHLYHDRIEKIRWKITVHMFFNAGFNIIQVLLGPITQQDTFQRIVLFDSAYYLDEIPIRIDWKEIVGIGTVTLMLSAIASYLPAWNAGRVRPLDVLRKH